MATNPYVNKVEFGGQTLIDLTQDTVTAADVTANVWFHLPSGQRIIGTIIDGNLLEYGNAIPAVVGTAMAGLSKVGGAS